jgi:hypothetical protein
MSDAELEEVAQPLDCGVEGSCRGERAYMQFVDDGA